MKHLIIPTLFLASCTASQAPPPTPSFESYPTEISADLSERFTRLALDCVQQEFPNKISRTTDTAEEIRTPQELFPVFYGCFDWHSAVHGHWLLVRQLRVGPQDAAWRADAVAKLDANITPENVAGELANFRRAARGSWERPYGWAWVLQLTGELREYDDPNAKQWLAALEPLEADIVQATKDWLPKLAYPIRLGTHNQTSFAFSLMLDWAEISGDEAFADLIRDSAMKFHQNDENCPLAYEPSGEDFLSPCLMTADLMRRVIANQKDYADWLSLNMPDIPTDGTTDWLPPAIVKDASDGKLVHLDGVNSSRAWNLYNMSRALPEGDPRRASLVATANIHRDAGVAAVSDEHYSGSHWLASFATYLMTDRGWND